MIKDKNSVPFWNSKEMPERFHHRRKRYFGHSWLGWLNYIIFQWLCIRLTEVVDTDKDGKEINSKFEFDYWIKPMSGWKDDFKYLGKKDEIN